MRRLQLLVLWILVVSCSSDKHDTCIWTDKQNSYNIHSLQSTTNYKVEDVDTSMGMFNMIYEFNFCTWGVKCQNREVAAFEALEVMGKVTENCDTLGTRETQEFKYLDPSNPDKGISINYSQGDLCFDVKSDDTLDNLIDDGSQMKMVPRSVSFQITCSDSNDATFTVIDSSKCNIKLGIKHQAGCKNGSSNSSIISYLKWIIIIAGLYLGGGAAYNIKKNNMQGIEAVPNIEQLRKLPFLLKDGILYCFRTLFGMTRRLMRGGDSSGMGYAVV